MSLGENSLVAAYQGKGQLKSRPSGTRVVTIYIKKFLFLLLKKGTGAYRHKKALLIPYKFISFKTHVRFKP